LTSIILSFAIAILFMAFYILVVRSRDRKRDRENAAWQKRYLNTDWKREYDDTPK
jgi:hypothetical protein